MLANALIQLSHLSAAGPDGRWLGQDNVLALLAATFPAWTVITLVRGWFRPKAIAAGIRPGR
jgi:hypothetical protein